MQRARRTVPARGSGLVLGVALLVAALAACSGESDTSSCLDVEAEVLDRIAERYVEAVSTETTLSDGTAVEAAEHGSGFVVAAQIRSKTIATGPGYWWVSDLSGSATTVAVAAPFADQFTTWPPGETLTPPLDPRGTDVLAARMCLVGL